MIVEKRKVDGATVLVVEGVIKLGESGRFFADALKRTLSEDTGHVLVDLERINFIDSTGIGELVGYLVRFQEQKRKLILIRPPDRVRRLCPQPVGADERTFKMDAEDARFVRRLRLGNLVHSRQGSEDLRGRRGHGRRQERGRAMARVQARGDAGGLAAVHHIGAAATVAVEIDEARNDHAVHGCVAADDRADAVAVK